MVRRTRSGTRASTPGPTVTRGSPNIVTRTAARRVTAGSFPVRSTGPYFLDRLGELVKRGFGEVEVHLHHDGDTAETLRREALEQPSRRSPGTATCRAIHARSTRDYRWAFIHGNWSLANGRPDGRWCGVDDELLVLHRLGCYADLTFPSAPDPCQPDQVNQIYWPTGDLSRRRAYEHGERARVGTHHDDRLLMITGPLALARKALGIRLENGAITGDDPPTAGAGRELDRSGHPRRGPARVDLRQGAHARRDREDRRIAARRTAATRCTRRSHAHVRGNWRLHYVTAREMFNVARAAMDGQTRRSERLLRLRRAAAADRAPRTVSGRGEPRMPPPTSQGRLVT